MYFGDKQMLERIAQQADECDELDELLNGSDNTTNTNSVALRDDVAERSTREYVDRCQQLSETMDRMFSVAQKISPSFPSIDLLDSGTDESIRRLSSDQAVAQFVSEMRHEGREDIDSKRLRLFCVASSDQARKMKLTRKMSSGSIGLRIGDIMGALAYVGNVPVVSLLPGGEFVPEANRFVESLSTARKFTSAITDEFRDLEVEDGICRLLNTLQVVQLDLTVDDYVLLIFALLRVSLDKSMGKHSTLIISVIERVFEVATSADKMGEVADLLKSVLPSVAYSLLSLAKMIHSLSLVDNHSIDDLLVESVVAILINRSERAELIDCKSQLEAFTEAFLSLYPKDDFVSDRSNVWALILLMNAGIRPKVIETADLETFDWFVESFRSFGRSLQHSGNTDDKLIDIFANAALQRCRFLRMASHSLDVTPFSELTNGSQCHRG